MPFWSSPGWLVSCPLELDSSTFGSKKRGTHFWTNIRTVKKFYGAFWLKFRIPQNSDNIVLREMQRFGRFDVLFLTCLASLGFEIQQLEACSGHVWAKLVGVENQLKQECLFGIVICRLNSQLEDNSVFVNPFWFMNHDMFFFPPRLESGLSSTFI